MEGQAWKRALSWAGAQSIGESVISACWVAGSSPGCLWMLDKEKTGVCSGAGLWLAGDCRGSGCLRPGLQQGSIRTGCRGLPQEHHARWSSLVMSLRSVCCWCEVGDSHWEPCSSRQRKNSSTPELGREPLPPARTHSSLLTNLNIAFAAKEKCWKLPYHRTGEETWLWGWKAVDWWQDSLLLPESGSHYFLTLFPSTNPLAYQFCCLVVSI